MSLAFGKGLKGFYTTSLPKFTHSYTFIHIHKYFISMHVKTFTNKCTHIGMCRDTYAHSSIHIHAHPEPDTTSLNLNIFSDKGLAPP